MTTFRDETVKCAVCGKKHKIRKIFSTNSFGGCDLDTRPPEMKRSTLIYEINFCDKCFYANYDLGKTFEGFNKEVLKSEEYLAIVNSNILNDSAKSFLLAGQIYLYHCKNFEAGLCFLKAAWCFDDTGFLSLAVDARKRAFKCFDLHLKVIDDNTLYATLSTIIVDMLRRCGEFECAIVRAENVLKKHIDEIYKEILNFEIKLCKSRDLNCHTMNEL